MSNVASTRAFIGLFTLFGLFAGEFANGGESNSLLDISSDGRLLACSNRDSGSVTFVDLERREILWEIPVGSQPEGVSFLGPSRQLAVAVYGDDRIVLLDPDKKEVLGSVDVFDEPYGLASRSDGGRLYVTLDYPGTLVEIRPADLQVVRRIPVGAFTRGIAVEPRGRRALVTEFFTARVKAVDLESGTVVDAWDAATTDNLLRQIAVHPRRAKAFLPHIRSRVTAVHGEGSIFPYVSVLDTQPGDGRRRKRIPMDAFLGNRVTANPWEIALNPNGREAYVIFAGTNDMFACRVVDDDYRELEYRGYVATGANPRAVRVAPDGNTVYVYNALDFTVVSYDTRSLRRVAEIRVTENPLTASELAGKKLFYSALQPMVGRRWISCSSCHPDGQPDGRTWHNPEGLRNTQSLGGLKATHPLHWSADRDEVQDFEHTIRGPLMQGRGLVNGHLHDPLGEPNAGLSAGLDALAEYTNSHTLPLSPHAKSGLSDAAKRGRRLFFAAETGCATCHRGPYFTDSSLDAAGEPVRYDVGTGSGDPSEKLGPAYDTPTLLGIYRTAPYLHDGRASTLAEVFTRYNPEDRHGTTSHLGADEVADLVAFLKSLPYAE